MCQVDLLFVRDLKFSISEWNGQSVWKIGLIQLFEFAGTNVVDQYILKD